MVPQRLEKIESAPGNGMGSDALNLQHLVRGRATDRARLRLTNRKNDKVGKLQKKAPKALKSLDAELKSAPVSVGSAGRAPLGKPRNKKVDLGNANTAIDRHCEEPLRRSNPGAACHGPWIASLRSQ